MKRSQRLLTLVLALLILGCLPMIALGNAPVTVTTRAMAERIDKDGSVVLELPQEALEEQGFQVGDLVMVTIGGESLILPYCEAPTDVDPGKPALIGREGVLSLAVRGGAFARSRGLAEQKNGEADGAWTWLVGSDSLAVTISMEEAGGYYAQYLLHNLLYSNARSAYPRLTDEEFANFRAVTTTGMGKDRLYRTSTPINPAIGRASYADAALRRAKVTVVLNLADRPETLSSYQGFAKSYYSSTHYAPMSMDLDFTTESFRVTLARGLRFMAENPGVYAIHCTEGKDRTGCVVALLECLMGAAPEEIAADYMTTFYNYYGLTKEDPRYEIILNNSIVRTLCNEFGIETLEGADLAREAEEYLLEIGMSEAEIAVLRDNLAESRDAPRTASFVDVPDTAWYAEGIRTAYEAGWMAGTSATTFEPDAALTRAQLVTILWRMEGSPPSDASLPFADVPRDSWYTEAVRWTADVELVKGYDATHFRPMEDITREQLAAILYRSVQRRGAAGDGGSSFPVAYTDAAQVSDWAYEAMCWMTAHEIVTGVKANLLSPRTGASRAQMAVMLARLNSILAQ